MKYPTILGRARRASLALTERPRAKVRGSPGNFMHASDTYSSLWSEWQDQNAEALVWSLYGQRLHEDTAFSPHEHTESLALAMPWLSIGEFVNPYPRSTAAGIVYNQVLSGQLVIPSPHSRFIPVFYGRHDGGADSIFNVKLELYDTAAPNTVEATYQQSHECFEYFDFKGSLIDATSFTVDADGYRRLAFIFSGQSTSGLVAVEFYGIRFIIPRANP